MICKHFLFFSNVIYSYISSTLVSSLAVFSEQIAYHDMISRLTFFAKGYPFTNQCRVLTTQRYRTFEKHYGQKEKMVVTSIFFFSCNDFIPSKISFKLQMFE